MQVTRADIAKRGLTNCCPNCGGKTLFRPGKFFEVDKVCRSCGFGLEQGEGMYLTALAMNYIVTCVCFLAPTAILWATGVLSVPVAAGVGIGFALVIPILLYRASRSWALAIWYYFSPQLLPANGGTEEANR